MQDQPSQQLDQPSQQLDGAARGTGLQLPAGATVAAGVARPRRLSLGRHGRTIAFLAVPALLVGVLAWPMLFTGNDFNEDWAHHLWFIWNQSFALREYHHPSFFLNTVYSVYYPEYAFYAGTLDVLGALLSLALGDAPIVAYVLCYLLGFAAAYGGWCWLARAAGLRGWWAHVPGVVFITSAYYITLIYARGDLPEFLGISTIPLLVASVLSVLRADRLRLWPALALVVAGVVFFGSHNLTVVWGSTFMVLLALALLACIPQARRAVTLRGALRVAVLLVPALLVSAWFLLPAAAYESHTQISSEYPEWRLTLRETMSFVSVHNLFAVSRSTAIAGSEFVLTLPVLAMAWALLSVPVCWLAGARGAWTRALTIFTAMAVLATVVMTHAGLILALPRAFAILQYSYRLESYVMLAASGAVLAGLAALRGGGGGRRLRAWTWVLVPIVIVAIVGAIGQTGAYPHDGDRQAVLASRTRSDFTTRILTDYTDAHLPVLAARGKPVEVVFGASAIRDDRISRVVHLRPGQLVYSNIGGGPELVHVSGARIVGVNPQGNDILEIGPARPIPAAGSRARWTEVISLSPAGGSAIVLGRVLSLAAIAFLLALFAVLGGRTLSAAYRRRLHRA